jgi:hypothetical protein
MKKISLEGLLELLTRQSWKYLHHIISGDLYGIPAQVWMAHRGLI